MPKGVLWHKLFCVKEQESVKSPCIGFCRVESNICQGCGRTLDEVSRWGMMTSDEKSKVAKSAQKRLVMATFKG